jgi:hypothetical protein
MSLPMDVTTITVTAEYQSILGVAAGGSVTFTPSVTPLLDDSDAIFFEATPVIASVTGGAGALSVVLPTTDQFSPANWTYQVNENITFGANQTFTRAYYVALPSTLGSTVNLIALAPLSIAPATYSYLPTAGGTMTGTIAMGSHKITGLANGSASTDAAAYGQTPAGGNTVTITEGGTGQTTRQAALNTLAGAVTTAEFLRGDGTNISVAAIQAGDVPTLNQNTSGTAAGLSSTLVIGSGGTGQTTAAAAYNALSPMTTAGDTVYGGTAGAGTRLAGNTTATKNFLTQTGTGSASAAPAWGTIAAGDVPTLNQNTSGSAGSFTGSLAGDVTGTQGSTTVAKVQGVAITSAQATLVSDLNNATARTATATLLPGEETIFSGSTASQTLTLPASPPSSSVNTVTNAASVSVTLAPGAGATLSNFGTSGNITVPSGYTFAVVYIGTTWYVQSAGPSDFAKSSALAIANGGTGATTQQAAINALAGAVTSAQFLRGNGSNVQMSAIQAGDVPTLNQNTSGSSASCTGNAATATNLAGGATLPDYLAPAVSTLTFVGSGTTLVNAALGNAFNLTLTASTTTLGNPSNSVDGQSIRVRVTQGSGGSFTLAYGTAYDFGASGAPTLTTTAAKVDILAFEYVGSISKWVYLGSALGA